MKSSCGLSALISREEKIKTGTFVLAVEHGVRRVVIWSGFEGNITLNMNMNLYQRIQEESVKPYIEV